MQLLIFTVCITILSLKGGHSVSYSDWKVYKKEFGKNYPAAAEDDYRSEIFFRNSMAISQHNERYANHLVSYKKGINQFTDQTEEERSRTKNLALQSQVNNWNDKRNKILAKPYLQPVPKLLNWMDKGAVTPIKNQYYCGSCYAFGAVAALESYHFLKTGQLRNFSEQLLLDCAPYNQGCVGGNPFSSFLYAAECGVMLEEDYDYQGIINPTCSFKSEKSIISISDFAYLEPKNEDVILREIATNGPVVVSLDSRHFHEYSEGILDTTEGCGATDHVVTLIGYGTDENGGDFYIVKNSWGNQWGEKGYLRIARGVNYCSLAEFALTANYS